VVHDYHQGAENYNAQQLLHDHCDECKRRSEHPAAAIDKLKDVKAAWHRAYRFEKGWLAPEELPISEAEVPILRILWALQIRLNMDGVPLGAYPGDLATVIRQPFRAQGLELIAGPSPLTDALSAALDHLADPTGHLAEPTET